MALIPQNSPNAMLKLNINALCITRGVQYPLVYLQKIGIPRHSARNMLNGTPTHLNFRYLNILCKAFVCTPNDLLEYTPAQNEQLPPDHPLLELKRENSGFNLLQYTAKMPLTELHQLIRQIQTNSDKNQETP